MVFWKIIHFSLSAAALLIAMSAVLGYALDERAWYKWNGTGMAFNTAVALLCIALAEIIEVIGHIRTY